MINKARFVQEKKIVRFSFLYMFKALECTSIDYISPFFPPIVLIQLKNVVYDLLRLNKQIASLSGHACRCDKSTELTGWNRNRRTKTTSSLYNLSLRKILLCLVIVLWCSGAGASAVELNTRAWHCWYSHHFFSSALCVSLCVCFFLFSVSHSRLFNILNEC